jgi:hypothetical protein
MTNEDLPTEEEMEAATRVLLRGGVRALARENAWNELEAENERLRRQLEEANVTIRALVRQEKP